MAAERRRGVAGVELVGLGKRFPNGVEALVGVDLTVTEGERIAVVGPSGSGKSTLLRLVAGLEEPTAGIVSLGGRDATGLPPWRRDVGLVFQQPALLPHLNVFDNLAFGLRTGKLPRDRVRDRVDEVAQLLGLAGLLDRRPASLSGGQAQRVAIGRALARRPAVLLLDEPLAGLDAPLRAAIRRELEEIQRRLRLTTILVTHDQAEALAFGDRAAVLVGGRLLQCDVPQALYDRPANLTVAGFLGSPAMDLLPGTLQHEGPEVVLTLGGAASLRLDEAAWAVALIRRGAGPVWIGVRPEAVERAAAGAEPPHPPAGRFLIVGGRVVRVITTGHEEVVEIALERPPATLHMRRAPGSGPVPPARIELAIDPEAATWFDPETGARIGG
jgi:ABC-type sugar transport system ATPase subunit